MAKQLKKPKYFISVNGLLVHETASETIHFDELEKLKKLKTPNIQTYYKEKQQSYLHTLNRGQKNYRVQASDYDLTEAPKPEPVEADEFENKSL